MKVAEQGQSSVGDSEHSENQEQESAVTTEHEAEASQPKKQLVTGPPGDEQIIAKISMYNIRDMVKDAVNEAMLHYASIVNANIDANNKLIRENNKLLGEVRDHLRTSHAGQGG